VKHQLCLRPLLSQFGRRDPDGYEYRGARGVRFSISPGSTLFKESPEWIMAAELVETTRLWAREQLESLGLVWTDGLGARGGAADGADAQSPGFLTELPLAGA